MNIIPRTIIVIPTASLLVTVEAIIPTIMNPIRAKNPTVLANIEWNTFALSPDAVMYFVLETKWPIVLPVFNGMTITLRIIIIPETPKRIVVVMPVSFAVITRAAKRTEKLTAKLTHQLIERFIFDANSKPSGNPVVRGVFAFFAFTGFLEIDFATGALETAFGTSFTVALGMAFAAAFGFFSGAVPTFPALSSSPIFSRSLIHTSNCLINFKLF